ncbi:MAG: PQQ-binding-like beta-propeller repeat protein [Planctomycetota bacterium]|nr:PQQ-binding-like beta-propeller repeat protein [Acidobacteriota bacterium]MDQ3438990.1 PQQ-binding-like beta-propeller repeat protein [Planctomycetota bacterium]
MRRSFCVTFAICLSCAFSAGLAAENWPQWRGPGGQGISTEKQLPTEWSPATNVAWKVELPHGYSSPIVWGDRIFLTSAIEGEVVPGHIPESVRIKQPHPQSVAGDKKHALKLLALDAQTGKIVWEQTAYEGPVFDARHQRSTFAGPTAVTDGKMVYAYFGPEGLFAYDTSGKLAWKMVEKFHTAGLGAGTSPILHENLVILQRDEDNETSVVVAYDKTSGKEVWKTKRPVQISWSTPVIVTAGSRTELVTNGSEHVISYDPATGKELWKTTGVQSNAIHTPLVGKGLVIVTAGYPAKKIIAIRTGDQLEDKRVAWQHTKGTGYVLSNILYGDYVYLSTDNGILTCLDAATGAVKYEGGRPPKPTHFMGSAVAYDGLIAMTSEDGDTYMIKAGPAHQIVRVNSVDEPVYSSLALANGRVYIRGTKHLYAIGK